VDRFRDRVLRRVRLKKVRTRRERGGGKRGVMRRKKREEWREWREGEIGGKEGRGGKREDGRRWPYLVTLFTRRNSATKFGHTRGNIGGNGACWQEGKEEPEKKNIREGQEREKKLEIPSMTKITPRKFSKHCKNPPKNSKILKPKNSIIS
jgi:hypothetical protein